MWFSESPSIAGAPSTSPSSSSARTASLVEKASGATFFVIPAKEEEPAKDDRKDDKEESAEGDKDRVVKKSDGNWTYFREDIAYHSDKLTWFTTA